MKIKTENVELVGNKEYVEIKGYGHPDSISDKISKRCSDNYISYTKDRFGKVLQHNVDNVVIRGADSSIEIGSAKIIDPAVVTISGAFTGKFTAETIPVKGILKDAVFSVISESIPGLVKAGGINVTFSLVIKKREQYPNESAYGVVNREKIIDSCFCNSFYPLSRFEKEVKKIYKEVEKVSLEKEEIGTDIKVLGARHGTDKKVIVRVPFIARHLTSKEDYVIKEEKMRNKVKRRFGNYVSVNSDKYPYLVVFGSALETRDVGSTGRGNYYNNIISTTRDSTRECPYGKSPYNYGGALFSELALSLSKSIYDEFGPMVSVTVGCEKGDNPGEPSFVHISTDTKVPNDEVIKIVESSSSRVNNHVNNYLDHHVI